VHQLLNIWSERGPVATCVPNILCKQIITEISILLYVIIYHGVICHKVNPVMTHFIIIKSTEKFITLAYDAESTAPNVPCHTNSFIFTCWKDYYGSCELFQ